MKINRYLKLYVLLGLFCLTISCFKAENNVAGPDTDIKTTLKTIEVYPGIEKCRSPRYIVTVTQGGKTYESFVFYDENKYLQNKYRMTDFNHWSSFSFEGEVTVEIKRLLGTVQNCKIHPFPKNIHPVIVGNTVKFILSKPEQLFVEMQGEEEDPLFIFANPIDIKPNPKAANVVYWGPGVHNIGKHYPLKSGMTYYLAGGAYIKGSFLSDKDASNITVRGRGILSGKDIEHGYYRDVKFEPTAIYFQGAAKNILVEGITIINPGQYCIQGLNGSQLETENIKCFGWWPETDGWVGGQGSKLKNSFFKVYDDIVKLYYNDLTIENINIYKQRNGSVFQLGWGGENSARCIARNIYVMCDETLESEIEATRNRGFVDAANGSEKNAAVNLTISDVWYDENMSYLLGIKTLGIYDNLLIKNVEVHGKQMYNSFLKGGIIKNIKLQNVSINGKVISSDNDILLEKSGISVDTITYLK